MLPCASFFVSFRWAAVNSSIVRGGLFGIEPRVLEHFLVVDQEERPVCERDAVGLAIDGAGHGGPRLPERIEVELLRLQEVIERNVDPAFDHLGEVLVVADLGDVRRVSRPHRGKDLRVDALLARVHDVHVGMGGIVGIDGVIQPESLEARVFSPQLDLDRCGPDQKRKQQERNGQWNQFPHGSLLFRSNPKSVSNALRTLVSGLCSASSPPFRAERTVRPTPARSSPS